MSATKDRDATERASLAAVIDKHRVEIERRWLTTVLERISGNASPTELRDAMPDYLRGLVEALRGPEASDSTGEAAWADVAREHAVTRVHLGFDIDELVNEFIVLRRVFFQIAEEEHLLVVDGGHAARLADLIERAISVSVKSYVQSRDYEARQREAEHIGFVTHELRNPLSTAVLAAAQLGRSFGDSPPRQLLVLEKALGRMSALIDRVLESERLDAGKVEAHAIDVSLAEVAEQPLLVADDAARKKGLSLEVRIQQDARVHVDPQLTSSALFNLLENAVKYTDEGRVIVEADVGPEGVVVHVRDNCPGIPEEDLKTIFDPFERGGSDKPGTGLGLAIARRALEAEGGTLGGESKGERGCHFWMTLPLPQPAR